MMALFLCLAAFTPVFANAQNVISPELQTLIDRLAKLEKEYNELRAAAQTEEPAPSKTPLPPSVPCYKFLTDVGKGDGELLRKADVAALQNFLAKTDASIDFLTEKKAGIYGAATFRSVVAFQKKNGLPSTGFVGPLTRGLLNVLYACPLPKPAPVPTPTPSKTPVPSPTPPPKIYPVRMISPNGGEFLYVGTKTKISWDPGSYSGKLMSLYVATDDAPTTTKLIADGIQGTSFLWTIKYPEFGKNTFKFRIIAAPEGNLQKSDASDAPVTIYFGDLGVIPEIAFQSPILATYNFGDIVRLEWKLNTESQRKFKLTLIDIPTGATRVIANNVSQDIVFNWETRTFDTPVFVMQKNAMVLPVGPYKIRIECTDGLCQPVETMPFQIRI